MLHAVHLKLGDEVTLELPEVRVSHRWWGSPVARVERARFVLQSDPLASLSRVQEWLRAPISGVEIDDVSLDYQHRSVGHWRWNGVKRGSKDGAFTIERATLGPQSWSDASVAVALKERSLEVEWGSDTGASARVKAKYLAPDPRAAEWIVVLPQQPLGAFGPEASRISGTLSWIVQSDPERPPRGGFRLVLDHWDKPAWPEASALTGSSGSVGALVLPAADGVNFRLERVEVVAALFTLQGSGSFTPRKKPELTFTAKGQRTCSELAEHLAPSRYRDLVRAKLEQGIDPGWVELELAVEVSLGPSGSTRARWHLSPGCGLGELSSP